MQLAGEFRFPIQKRREYFGVRLSFMSLKHGSTEKEIPQLLYTPLRAVSIISALSMIAMGCFQSVVFAQAFVLCFVFCWVLWVVAGCTPDLIEQVI